MALSEMNHIFADQPGLLGPKALIALLALSHARDEVQWLVRHKCNPAPKGKKVIMEDYEDKQVMPEDCNILLGDCFEADPLNDCFTVIPFTNDVQVTEIAGHIKG